MGFSKQAYWSGLPFPSPGVLPNPGMELTSPVLAGEFFFLPLITDRFKFFYFSLCKNTTIIIIKLYIYVYNVHIINKCV